MTTEPTFPPCLDLYRWEGREAGEDRWGGGGQLMPPPPLGGDSVMVPPYVEGPLYAAARISIRVYHVTSVMDDGRLWEAPSPE
jgi:hypothetical protein